MIVALSVIILACADDPRESLPPVAGRVDQTEADFEWPWCEVPIPSLHGCGEFGSLSDIGDFISEQNVCTLIGALHQWLAVRHWETFENVRVCRTSQWVVAPELGESIARDRPRVWLTHIKVDIPEHGIQLWVFLHEATGEVTFDTESL